MDKLPPMEERLLRLLHHRSESLSRGEAIGLPVQHTSAFYLPNDPQDGDYSYTRDGNPTWTAVEAQLSILEAAPALAFPSGMAAISAIMLTELRPGDTLIMPSDGYYGVRAFAAEVLVPFGIEVTHWPTVDYAHAPIAGAKMILIESPSNPGLDAFDIKAVVEQAHAAGVRVAVDNTTMTPLLQQPLDLGADLVAVSDTKAMSGHGDVLFGHVASRDEDAMKRIATWRKVSGAIPGPAEAALVHRGLETLEVRLERMCANAMQIATRLKTNKAVSDVRYPGLPGDPSHGLMAAQARDFGFVVGFCLPDKSSAEAFLSACSAVTNATSFGSIHTSAERRARWGEPIPDGFIRLSVGCEPLEPLWSDIERALNQAGRV
ncbi:MAG: cystathionine gamma-lyase [Pseudomonadota bacterium]